MPTRHQVKEFSLAASIDTDLPKIEWESATSFVPEEDTVEIKAKLSHANHSGAVGVLSVADGTTAIYGEHWQLCRAADSEVEWDKPTLTFASGATEASIFLRNLNYASGKTTLKLQLVESVVWVPSDGGDTVNYAQDGVQLSDSNLDHTATLQNPGTYTVSFEVAESEVTEPPSGSTTHKVKAKLSKTNATGGALTVTCTKTGTATRGADYTWKVSGGAEDTSDDLPLSFANGDSEEVIEFSILPTGSDTADKTATLALGGAGAGLAVGSGAHTLSINSLNLPAAVGALTLDPAAVELTEGERITIPVTFTPTSSAKFAGFAFGVEAAGTEAGPTGVAARAARYKLLTAVGEIPADDEGDGIPRTFDIELEAVQDAWAEPDSDVRVQFSAYALPVGVGLDVTAKTKTITIKNAGAGSGGGVDGDLTDYTGTRIANERLAIDAASPDLSVLSDSSGGPEYVRVHLASGGVTDYPVPNIGNKLGSGIQYAISSFAEDIWKAKNTGYANSAAAPFGAELLPVVITLEVTGAGGGGTTHDGYVFIGGKGRAVGKPSESGVELGETNPVVFGSGAGEAGWSDGPVRDTVLIGSSSFTCASMPEVEIDASSYNGAALDNVRFERVAFRFGTEAGGFRTSRVDTEAVQCGRIKLYDCMHGVPYDAAWKDAAGVTRTTPVHRYAVRGGQGIYDIRHAQGGVPWESVYPGWEHGIFLDNVGLAVVGDADAYGSHFINLRSEERLARNHPDRVQSGAYYWGPKYGGTQTAFIQIDNRATEHNVWSCGSQPMNFVRCGIQGMEGSSGSVPTAIVVNGHNGHVRFIDCSVAATGSGKCGGAIALGQNYGGNYTTGPEGRYRIELDSRTYATKEVTIEGLSCSGNSQGASGISLYGVRVVRLRSFRFFSWGGPTLYLGSAIAQPGDGSIKELRTDVLWTMSTNAAYTGVFSAYEGWAPNNTKVVDATHANWWASSTNARSIPQGSAGNLDVDNLPTDGPGGYTQSNGIIDQHYAKRTEGTWGSGTGAVDDGAGSPAWVGGTYTSSTQPNKPNVGILGEATQYFAEGVLADEAFEPRGLIAVDWQSPSQSAIRVYYKIADAAAVASLDVRVQKTWADGVGVEYTEVLAEAATAATGHVVAAPVGGKSGAGVAGDTDTTPSPAEDSTKVDYFWKDSYYSSLAFRLRPKASLGSGTKTLTLTLDDSGTPGGGNQPDFETYPGSTSYEDCLHTYKNQQITIKIIPAVDYPATHIDGPDVVTTTAGGGVSIWRSQVTSDSLKIPTDINVHVSRFDHANSTWMGMSSVTNLESYDFYIKDEDGTELATYTVTGDTTPVDTPVTLPKDYSDVDTITVGVRNLVRTDSALSTSGDIDVSLDLKGPGTIAAPLARFTLDIDPG